MNSLNDAHSLSHTKWNYKYRRTLAPAQKYKGDGGIYPEQVEGR